MDRMNVACSDQLTDDCRRRSDRDLATLCSEHFARVNLSPSLFLLEMYRFLIAAFNFCQQAFINELMYERMRDLSTTAERYHSEQNSAWEEREQQVKRAADTESQLGEEKKAKFELE